jgi:hypothetical protein
MIFHGYLSAVIQVHRGTDLEHDEPVQASTA